jgi:phage tail tape-measure protein
MSRRVFDIIFKTKGIDKAKTEIGEADNKLSSFGATAKQTSTILATTLGAATIGAGIKAVKTAGEFEMLRVRLKSLTGSQKEANRLFDEFNKIATQTPF